MTVKQEFVSSSPLCEMAVNKSGFACYGLLSMLLFVYICHHFFRGSAIRLVSIPGALTGIIMGGASPLEACSIAACDHLHIDVSPDEFRRLTSLPPTTETVGMDWKWLKEFAEGMIKPAAALIVVVTAMALSYMHKLGLEGEMIYSIFRSFLQLSIISFVIQFIFNQNNTISIVVAYLFMVCVAGYTAGQRAKHVPRGMIVSTAMKVTGVTMKGLRDEIKIQKTLVETALALGSTPRQATIQQVKRSVVIALSPVLDNAKAVGLVSFPGALSGLIMGGTSPLEAVQLQLVITNMFIGTSTVSSIMSTYLCWRYFFTKAYHLETKVFISD
ncbi:hypothetical protein ACH5RR_004801 [Cinchona calisaya]|uniref:Uncharacterized protein n=1 Tax=Cinchona calisaya TaxID=153742 RepID=A0ABD3AYN0_9GENT